MRLYKNKCLLPDRGGNAAAHSAVCIEAKAMIASAKTSGVPTPKVVPSGSSNAPRWACAERRACRARRAICSSLWLALKIRTRVARTLGLPRNAPHRLSKRLFVWRRSHTERETAACVPARNMTPSLRKTRGNTQSGRNSATLPHDGNCQSHSIAPCANVATT